MSLNKKILISVIIIAAIISCSYAFELNYKKSALKAGIMIDIEQDGKSVAVMDSGVLNRLPTTINKDAQKKEGPALLSVLNSAGLSPYTYNKVYITSLYGDTPYEIKSSDISDDIIFYFASNKTVNLGRRSQYPNVLLKGVSIINVTK